MKILLLCDDYYHHSDIVIKGLDFLNETYTLDIIEDAHQFNVDTMNQYQVIIFSKSNNYNRNERNNWMTPTIENAFVEYVKSGGKLIVTHSGTAGYKETPIFRELIGGVFTHHPEQCDVYVEPITNHPILEGIDAFTIFDEHYHMDMYDENIQIIMNTKSHVGTQPGAWTKLLGKGKLFVFTPGHNLNTWQSSKQVILNTINWCLN